jgi:hypothetical protein
MDLIKQKTMEQGVDLQDLRDDIMETQRVEQAYGGRLGFAFGNKPEQNADSGSRDHESTITSKPCRGNRIRP